MKLLLFGTGKYYERFKRFFYEHEIVALLDNDIGKIGTQKDGISIICPEDGIELEFDKIILLSVSFQEMYHQLLELGISENRICTIYDIRSVCSILGDQRPLKIYCNPYTYGTFFRRRRHRIAIITHGMGRNGGDYAVLLAAKALRDTYDVDIISLNEGALKNDFLNLGMSVIIDEDLCVEYLEEAEWRFAYDLIIINGAIHHTLFSKNTSRVKIPIIWWIHSAGTMNSDVMLYRLEQNDIPQGNILTYGVSDRVIHSFSEQVPSWKMKDLCYGIPDVYEEDLFRQSKVIFAIIASFQSRKAQDVFLKSIKELPECKRILCEFWLIGSMGKTSFVKEVVQDAEKIKEVKVLGTFSNEELQKIYRKISVLVCPSLEDPMPIVCAEAMMHYHPCIVSDETGTAQYIIPEENGLICKAGDAKDLAKKMEWMIDCSSKLEDMGNEARKTYEKFFTYKHFKNKLLNIIQDALQTKTTLNVS